MFSGTAWLNGALRRHGCYRHPIHRPATKPLYTLHWLPSRYFVVSVIILICAISHTKAQDLSEQQIFASCAALAFIETGDYPEVLQLRGKEQEAWRLYEGQMKVAIDWNNRSFLLRRWLGLEMFRNSGEIPSNGDVSKKVSDFVDLLLEDNGMMKAAVQVQCLEIFKIADDTCAKEGCFLETRPPDRR